MKTKKLDAQTIFDSLTPCLPMSQLYTDYDCFIEAIKEAIQNFTFVDDKEKDIGSFLKLTIKTGEKYKNFINKKEENIGYVVLLAKMGISREQMKNIVLANHSFFNIVDEKAMKNANKDSKEESNKIYKKATLNQILKNKDLTKKLIELLMYGSLNEELIDILNGDIVTLRRFNLDYVLNLKELFSDEKELVRDLEDTYKSRMQNKKGYYTEKIIIASIVEKLGLHYDACDLPVLGEYFERENGDTDKNVRSPSIDLVIPSKDNPLVMVESAYNLTTASGQTKKIDANNDLFQAINKYGKANKKEVLFINFLDGAGWKERGISDVSRLVSSCDYAFNYKNLDLFEKVLREYFKIEESK